MRRYCRWAGQSRGAYCCNQGEENRGCGTKLRAAHHVQSILYASYVKADNCSEWNGAQLWVRWGSNEAVRTSDGRHSTGGVPVGVFTPNMRSNIEYW